MEIFTFEGVSVLLRWFHVLAGVTWIGILYYFNFIQTPFFGTELGGQAKGAMITWITGVLIILTKLGHDKVPLDSAYMTLILTGGLMGTFMWANVWFVIWPAQQVVIASAEKVAAGGEADPAAASRGARAGLASRTNTLFSVPMLFFMVAAANLQRLATPEAGGGVGLYWICALVVIFAVEANALIRPGLATQKPLASVRGTLHAGVVLAIVLYALMAIAI
ncbi:MAG TPA: urate hydroxylase PuuD [Myxococcota bacterium]